jgi:hypothetical protein
MKNYLESKLKRLDPGNITSLRGITIVIRDKLEYDFKFYELEEILEHFKTHLISGIEYVIFGKFETLIQRGTAAAYDSGIVYVSSVQVNNSNVVDDIVHEIGHHVETKYGEYIYGDGAIRSEFLQKRKLLSGELEKSGYFIDPGLMKRVEYSEELDTIFYKHIGYPMMTPIVQGIFYSPYGSTSLREYFANGFEAYFYHKDMYLKKVSPVLYKKIESLEMEGK